MSPDSGQNSEKEELVMVWRLGDGRFVGLSCGRMTDHHERVWQKPGNETDTSHGAYVLVDQQMTERLAKQAGESMATAETTWEVYYHFRAVSFLNVQPDFQYVMHPDTRRDIDDAQSFPCVLRSCCEG